MRSRARQLIENVSKLHRAQIIEEAKKRNLKHKNKVSVTVLSEMKSFSE